MLVVTNEEYKKAWEKQVNQKILASSTKKFRFLIPEDELTSCKMIALWKTLGSYDDNHITKKKFVSLLYDIAKNCCISWIRDNKDKINAVSLYSDIESYDDSNFFETVYLINNSPLEAIILDRFYYKMTLKEIADKNDCSIETIRRKIFKAVKIIKDKI